MTTQQHIEAAATAASLATIDQRLAAGHLDAGDRFRALNAFMRSERQRALLNDHIAAAQRPWAN